MTGKATAGLLALLLAGPPGLTARDEIRAQQWHLDFLNIDQAHKISTGEGVIVGVIDTGVDATHPDLTGTLLPGADFSFFQNPDAWEDLDGHGTAMAGIISAHGQALGIAPDATILPVRDATDSASRFPIMTHDAIDYAVDHGATVLCLAFAGDEPTQDLELAIEHAIANDVVVVAGVGNTPMQYPQYPASFPGVVAVAGTDRDGNHAEFSVVGPSAMIAAPAVDIMTPRSRTVIPEGYGTGTGTSDATAIIAGVAALIRAEYPDLSAADVINRITATAEDRGAPGRDDEYGFGIVDPVAALTVDIPPLEPTGTPATSQPTASAPGTSPTAPVLVAVVGAGVVVLLVVGLVVALRRRT